jgi:hypothetical protein
MNPLRHFIKRDISKDRSIDDDHKETEGNNSKHPIIYTGVEAYKYSKKKKGYIPAPEKNR